MPAVPSPPANLTIVETTPTSLSIEWGPPLQPNGIILTYLLHYSGIETLNLVPSSFYNESVIQLNTSSTSAELMDLVPYSLYNITVQAVTRVEIGDPAVVTVRTNETRKFSTASYCMLVHTMCKYHASVFVLVGSLIYRYSNSRNSQIYI